MIKKIANPGFLRKGNNITLKPQKFHREILNERFHQQHHNALQNSVMIMYYKFDKFILTVKIC